MKQTPEQPTEQPAVTPEQHLSELRAWLAQRNLQVVPVAVGLRTGQQAQLLDFLPTTHTFDWALIPDGK